MHNHEGDFTLLIRSLSMIIIRAALLSLALHLDDHTVYHFPAAYKDMEYDPDTMECFNEASMRANDPKTRGWPEGTPAEEIQRAKLDEPLVRINIMAGCTAYRRGGWQNEDGSYIYDEGASVEDKGIRSRVLTHSWVYCRWGRKRRWDGKDGEKVHGVLWREPGFVEFREFLVEVGKRRKGKGKARSK